MNYSNNAFSVLNGSITNVATTITLATGTGSRFPASDFRVTLIGYDGSGNENAWEICHCSSRAGDVLTVARGQEGTTAAAWANASRIEQRVTAAQLNGVLEKAGGDMSGDLGFTGIGRRIRGLMSSATALVDRLLFQSSTTNGSTDLSVLPNGTSNRAGFGAINSSDTTNHAFVTLLALATDMRLWSGKSGTGTLLPLKFFMDNSEIAQFDTSGNFGVGKTPGAKLDWRETVDIVSTNTTAVASRTYVLTASLTLTLPLSPAAGDWVCVVNRSGTTTPVVGRNAQNIMGLAEDMTLNSANASVRLTFADATRGWVIS